MKNNHLALEWQLLQNQSDSYEKYSLLIKLVNFLFFVIILFNELPYIIVLLTMLTLWLLDAIWKTFQSRITTRLIQLEHALSSDKTTELITIEAYQFNRQFLSNRANGLALITEYFSQAIKPSIAFLHFALIVLFSLNQWW